MSKIKNILILFVVSMVLFTNPNMSKLYAAYTPPANNRVKFNFTMTGNFGIKLKSVLMTVLIHW
jgi:hypothetical protein